MEYKSQQDDSGSDSDKEYNPGQERKPKGTETKLRVRKFLIYYFFSTMALGLASFLISWDRGMARYAVLGLLAFFVLAGLGIRLQLINHGSSHRKSTRWLWAVVGPGVALCVFLFWSEWKSPKPHLALYLTASDSPQAPLYFTNDFLNVKGRGPGTSLPDRLGFVVIRVPFTGTNVVLNFGVLNDSAAQYEVVDDSVLTVEVAGIDLMILPGSGRGPAIGWAADAAWKQKATPDGRGKLMHFPIPTALLPGRGEPAPGITFTNTGHLTDNLVIMATLRGKRIPQTHFIFNLIFIPSNEIIAPSLLGPTNPVAAIILEKRKPSGATTNTF